MADPKLSNEPRVLVELSPEEITWLADRLHDFRQQATALSLRGASLVADKPEAEEKFRKALEEVDHHKKMEAAIRNRILNKAADQGFGDL